MHQDAIIALSVIGIAAAFCQWLSWSVKLPAILFLLLAGILLGPVTGWLNPDELFGDLFFPMVALAVAIILFEGSLTLKFHEIAGLETVVRNLLTIGVAIIWLITAVSTRYFLGFSWELSWLFGAIMVVTGPTVVTPILRTVRPNSTISNILRWEGIVIDPLGAILAVLVFEFIMTGQNLGEISLWHTLFMFSQTLFFGIMIGAVAGYSFGLALRHHIFPEYLQNITTLTLVFAVFTLSNVISEESGLLAVTVMGVWLANMDDVMLEEILDFKEHLSILFISGLFILLAARLDLAQFLNLGYGAVIVFLIMQFVARPIKVILSAWNTSLTWQEKTLIAWIGPRGIVAAAVTALFAIRLEEVGIEQAAQLVPLAFAVIIGTVVLQSATAKIIARQLGVSEPGDKGFLIIGANIVARTLAKALNENGFRTRLTDSSWENVKAARMEGLDTYYGNAVSEHADRHLDLIGLGQMLAITPQNELNTLACMRYRSEFGKKHCFYLQNSVPKKNSAKESRVKLNYHIRTLFGAEITYAKLASLLSQDAKIHQTKLSKNFTFEDYLNEHGKNTIPLFAITANNHLLCFTQKTEVTPEASWIIISLVQKTAKEMENNAQDGL